MTTPLTPEPTPAAPTAPASPTAPAPPVAPAKRASGGRAINILLGVAALIAVGGVAFAMGRSTAPASAATFPDGAVIIGGGPFGSFDPGAGPGAGPGGPGLVGAGGPTIEGTVTEIDADSLTIRLPSGDDLEIALDHETTWHESTATDPGSVQVGDDVAVRADGGRITIRGQGASQGSDDLTADDVTVRR